MGAAPRVVLLFLVLLGLYLFFAGEVSTVEVIAGIVAAAAATALGIGLVAVAKKHFRVAPPPRAILRPLAALLPETFAVGYQLIRVALRGAGGQQGGFIQQPFDPGGDDARSSGRRAAVVIGVSLAPRTFVIRGDRGESLLLHGWPEKRPSADKAWPA
jgi:hypothetical protein